MVQSTLACYGQSVFSRSFHDNNYLRRSLTPDGNYRCPVSTPANDISRHDDIRRSNTLHVVNLQYPTTGSDRQKSGRLRRGRNVTKYTSHAVIAGLQYHSKDKKTDMKQEQQGHWLRSLCAQPVDEILNKYRRKSDFIRTQTMWLQTFTTPGEKSLLNVWENNHHSHNHTILNSVDHVGTRLSVESNLRTFSNRNEPILSFERQMADVKRNVKSERELSSYSKRIKESNRDDRHFMTAFDSRQSVYNDSAGEGSEQLPRIKRR